MRDRSIPTTVALPRPEHEVPQRRRNPEMTLRFRVVVDHVILAKVTAETSRHPPAMNEVMKQVVRQIAMEEPGERRLADQPRDHSGDEKNDRENRERHDERHDPARRVV